MFFILGCSILFTAAAARAANHAGAAHPPTNTMRPRSALLGGDRRSVPLPDHGRRGGAARSEFDLQWLDVPRGPIARCATRTAFVDRARDSRLEHQKRADTSDMRSPRARIGVGDV